MTLSNRVSEWAETGPQQTEQAKVKAADLAQRSLGQTQAWLQRAGRYLGERPALSLAAALSLGVMIGWLIKRR